MIETTIINHLTEELEGVGVYAELQKEIVYPFVIVEKTGGNVKNHIKHSMITIQSYDKTLLSAAKLNEKVMNAMAEAIDLKEICSIGVNSNYNYTDTANKRYRYQAVFDVYHY